MSIVIALVYFILNKIQWLDNLGRVQRDRGEVRIENMLAHFSRLTVEYEEGGAPKGRFSLATSKEEEEAE